MCPLWLADIESMSTWGDVNSVVGFNADGDAHSYGQGLVDRLSSNPYSWFQAGPTRVQVLEVDKQYLDPEHLLLPRMKAPYPDIRKWSTDKKERHLRGLDWLIANSDDRLRRE